MALPILHDAVLLDLDGTLVRSRPGGLEAIPGAAELLAELAARGTLLGFASAASAGFVRAARGALGPAAAAVPARCLDDPGTASKAAMVADLLRALGTRCAVVVGDRGTDGEAAAASGLPWVRAAYGGGQAGGPPADAAIRAPGELVARLEDRARWVEEALERAGFPGAVATRRAPVLGVTGPRGAGTSRLARDAARTFERHGVPCGVVALDAFRTSRPAEPDDPLAAFDLDALEAAVLGPRARGEPVEAAGAAVPPDAALVLEGPGLCDPRLRPRLARVLALEVPEELALRRLAARLGPEEDPAWLLRLHRVELPAWRRHAERWPPATVADLVLDGASPLGLPGRVAAGPEGRDA